ncbi:ribonuclease H-like YkuK family protein [Baia soyae]|nr:ribonuclease H-like YkuK family protein [Baia soyae]
MHFYHPRRGKCSFEEMMSEIQKYVREDPNSGYKLMIGTDSMTRYKETVFVTAIIIQRVGKGALFFYTKRTHSQMKELRYRIYRETEYSLTCVDLLKEHGFFRMFSDIPMEIHLDIGQQGETRKVIQEVVGWVTAVGYEAKIKPESYAASAVADRFTR